MASSALISSSVGEDASEEDGPLDGVCIVRVGRILFAAAAAGNSILVTNVGDNEAGDGAISDLA